MSKKEKVHSLVFAIRSNYSTGVHTMGPCCNGCVKIARGSGRCLDCLEKELSELTNPLLANNFCYHTRRAHAVLTRMLNE